MFNDNFIDSKTFRNIFIRKLIFEINNDIKYAVKKKYQKKKKIVKNTRLTRFSYALW